MFETQTPRVINNKNNNNMQENIMKEETYKGYTIRIVADDSAMILIDDNPIDWCEINEKSTFFSNDKGSSYAHFMSELVENVDCVDAETYLSENFTHYLPIYGYSHSIVQLSLSNDSYPFNCPFDGFLFGIMATKDDKVTEEEYRNNVSGYIKSYNSICNGEVYGYQIIDKDGNETDSCYGFVGEDMIEDMIGDCKLIIDNYTK